MAALNISVPATWGELVATATAWNAGSFGSGAPASAPAPPALLGYDAGANSSAPPMPLYGLCLNDASYCTTSPVLSAILASITQRYGPRTGWALALDAEDPDAATRLVNGTAMAAALELYRALAAQSPSKLACQATLPMFAQGQCLMTLNWGRQFKALALQQNAPARGSVGIALTPGSHRVLDRASGKLIPAGQNSCRGAVQLPAGNWACRAPMLAYGGTFGVLGLRNDATYQQLGFDFLAFLMSSPTQWDGVLDPSSPVEPVRSSMLKPEAGQVLDGLGSLVGFGGYTPSDAEAYLTALRAAFSHPNIAPELGAPGSFKLRFNMEVAIQSYLAGVPAEAVADSLLQSWLVEWSARGYSVAQVQGLLLRSTPDPFGDAEAPVTPDTGGSISRVAGWQIALGVLLGVVVFTALFSAMCWARRRRARKAGLRRIVAPLNGADTTLVVTDIQDSTKMWETLSSDVMDAAIFYHHSLARKLMLRFQGYESATELLSQGDSFIIAFHAADDAVCFCASFQQELLLVAWPEELLAIDSCRPVFMCKSEPATTKQQRKSQPSVQLEVARTQGPLLSGQPSPLFRSPLSITPANLNEQGNSQVLGVANNAGGGDGGGGGSGASRTQAGGTIGITYATLAVPSGTSLLGAGPESPVPGPTPSMASASGHTVAARHLRTVASFAAPSSGQGSMSNMGALGASPRQLSFLGRSLSRLGAPPASGQASLLAAGGGSLERMPRGSPAISVSGNISGSAQAAMAQALPSARQAEAIVPGVPSDGDGGGGGADGVARGGSGAASGDDGAVSQAAVAAKAAFVSGSVMSFRESFRSEVVPGGGGAGPEPHFRSSDAGSAGSGRHTIDGAAVRVPTLSGYQPTPAKVTSPSADGAVSTGVSAKAPRSGANGSGGSGGAPGHNLGRDRSPVLARRSLPRSVSEAARHRRVRSGTGLGGGAVPEDAALADGTEGSVHHDGGFDGGVSGSDGMVERTTHNSRHSRSTATDMASVSEFNTVLESGGQHYVHARGSETGGGTASPPASLHSGRGAAGFARLSAGPLAPPLPPPHAGQSYTIDEEPMMAMPHHLISKMISGGLAATAGIASALREASGGSGIVSSGTPSMPTSISNAGSGGGCISAAGSAGGAGMVPSPNGSGTLETLAEDVPIGPTTSPVLSPRAAQARRGSVTFDFRPGANGGAAGTSSGGGVGGSEDQYFGTAASLPPSAVQLRYTSASQSSPQLVVASAVSTAQRLGSSDEHTVGNTHSLASNVASQGSSRLSPTHMRAAARAPSRPPAPPGAPAVPVPYSAASRAASLRRRSDTMAVTASGGFSELHPYPGQYGHGDGALRPSPLGRVTSHKAVGPRVGVRGLGASDSGRTDVSSVAAASGASHKPSANGGDDGDDGDDGDEHSNRGQSSPLPLIFVPDLMSEDGTGRGLPVGSVSGAPGGRENGSAAAALAQRARSAAGAAAMPAAMPAAVAADAVDSTRGFAAPDEIQQRHGSLVFPVKRSATQQLPVRRPGGAGGAVDPNMPYMGPAMRAIASTNSTGGRGLFGLVALPSPRPGGGHGPNAGGLLALGMGLSSMHAVDSRAASMASMMRLASQHNLQSVGDTLCTRWRVVEEREGGAQLMFRGLRVRMGVHSGLSGETDAVQLNRTANRMQYTGLGMQMAKAVCDCAHGGQVLLTQAAFMQLAVENLKERVMVLHMGEHRMKDELPSCSIYSACPRALQGRLPALRSIRSSQQHSLGVLDAPAGQVVVVFMHVVGAMSILDWRPDLAHTALTMFRDHVTLELIKYQGYLVEAVDGLVLASFSSPSAGLRWAVKCQHDMTMLPWPQELLSHEACEEWLIPRVNAVSGLTEEALLFRGLRLKAGVDMGRLRGEINCITGRMSYRGRAMNRAARIVAAAGTGQVLASAEVWTASSTQAAAQVCGLTATSMGQFTLKGVSEALELFRIKTTTEVISKRTKAMMNSQEDPLDLDELPIADPVVALQHHNTINNASSGAAATAAAASSNGAVGGMGSPPHSLRAASTSAAVGGAGGAGGVLPSRLLLERMHSMSGGLAAALRREESMSRGAGGKGGSISRQISRNVSMRSRRSSRRSSVGSQYSALAANTMVALARGSLDGRADTASPARSGGGAASGGGSAAAQPSLALPSFAGSGGISTQASISLTVPTPLGGAGSPALPPALVVASSTFPNASGSAGPSAFHLPYAGAPSVGSGTRTSRNSAGGDQADTEGTRSSNQRSSNASVRSGGQMPLLGRASHTAASAILGPGAGAGSQQQYQVPTAGGAAAAATTSSPVLLRPGPGPGLVRHLSTLIRSASMALYGTSAPHGGGPGGVGGQGPLSGPTQPLQTHGSVTMTLSPTPESGYDTQGSTRGSGGERRARLSVYRESTFTAASAAAMGLPSSANPSPVQPGSGGAAGGGGATLRELLPPRLRAAGALFRVGSFSGQVRRRGDDSATHTSEYGESTSVRGGRSPPGHRLNSTASTTGYVATAIGSASASGMASPPETSRRGFRRSSLDPLLLRSVERAGAAGRRPRQDAMPLGGLAEAPEVGEDSFVIVVGEHGDSDESEGERPSDMDLGTRASVLHAIGSTGGTGGGGPLERMSVDDLPAILQELDSFVHDELKVLSYKWVARHYSISANLAKRILFQYVEQQRDKVRAVFLVSGWDKQEPPGHVHQLVEASQLQVYKESLVDVTGLHVYSVAPNQALNPDSLWQTTYQQSQQLLKEIMSGNPSASADTFRKNGCSAVRFNAPPPVARPPPAVPAAGGAAAAPAAIAKAQPARPPQAQPAQQGDARGVTSMKDTGRLSTSPPKPIGASPPKLPAAAAKAAGKGSATAPAAKPGKTLANMWSKAPTKPKPATAAEPAAAAKAVESAAAEAVLDGDEDADAVHVTAAGNSKGRKRRGTHIEDSDDEAQEAQEDEAAAAAPEPASAQPAAEPQGKKAAAKGKQAGKVAGGDKEKAGAKRAKTAAAKKPEPEPEPEPAQKDVVPDAAPADVDMDDAVLGALDAAAAAPAPAQAAAPAVAPSRAAGAGGRGRKVTKTYINDEGEEVTDEVYEDGPAPLQPQQPQQQPAVHPQSAAAAKGTAKPAAKPAPAKAKGKAPAVGQKSMTSFFAKK
ncbi:hypothetical protein GPECTOR_76g803 [Gonium pectorale]|uniref:DNA polymerase delta subunit 3 n=1 Tax=Gonium pectorale TaxID=33097 RepID=A0A150G2F5_GONPE|nr:hypothetical protein GPECTOR_76g803 [Gonium pectorale]|eukprot:KXZ43981.1 hypothetical protein GPECTOR_76g803 [Gonium pectorale]